MKKKLMIAGILLCLIVSAVIYFSIPAPIISAKEGLKGCLVDVVNDEYMLEDITGQIDCDKLVQIISKYTRSRLPHSFAPYQLTVGEIDIHAVENNRPFHIILGNDGVNVIYSSAEKGGYTIHNSEKLFADIKALLTA